MVAAATLILDEVHTRLVAAALADQCDLNDRGAMPSRRKSRINVIDAGDARDDVAGGTLSIEGRALEIDIAVSVKLSERAAATARDIIGEVEATLRAGDGTLQIGGGRVIVERVDDEIGLLSEEVETNAIVLTARYSLLYRVRRDDPLVPLP